MAEQNLHKLLLDSANTQTPFDVARVAHHLLSGRFACSTTLGKRTAWFELPANTRKWIPCKNDAKFRIALSTDVWDHYMTASQREAQLAVAAGEHNYKRHYEHMENFDKVAHLLKKPTFKDSVMRECIDLFDVHLVTDHPVLSCIQE